MAHQDAPKDPFHAVGIIFFVLGMGTLLPWNFFITAIPYFQSRLATGNCSLPAQDWNETGRSLELGSCNNFNFNNWLTLLSQLPLLLFTLLNSFLYQCIPDRVRVLSSLSGILLLFLLTAALVKMDMSPQTFFSITMASVWFINSFCAVLQGSLFGQLGALPQRYTTLFLSGQGMAGTFAASAMLLSMASEADAQTSALSYFITPCIGTLISIICYLLLPHMEFARHCLLAKKRRMELSCELETKAGLLPPESSAVVSNGLREVPHSLGNGTVAALEEVGLESPLKTGHSLENGESRTPPAPTVLGVLRKIWLMAFCIVLVFTVTLSVFPAITASVTSTSHSSPWSKCGAGWSRGGLGARTPGFSFQLCPPCVWEGNSILALCLGEGVSPAL
uniref:Solute carrier family 29 member 2 n=1 Tax=Sphenodon punctatus TaxID=8508 RepID=A0A8D0GLP7_SPHPU